jgi:ABC-type lipoprotein export system ATPase subunit
MGKTAPSTTDPSLSKAAMGPIVRADGLSKSFRMGDSEIHVLRNVDLTIRAGEFVAIEGRSGSGKSTLLHILGALDAPNAGKVLFEGADYTRAPAGKAGRGVVGVLTNKNSLLIAFGAFLFVLFSLVMQLGTTARNELPWNAPGGWFTSFLASTGGNLLIAIPIIVAWAIRIRRSDADDRVSARIRNREFGFVFQFYHLLPELDVVENTMLGQMVRYSAVGYFGQRAALRARAKTILDQLGMGHRLTHRPNQLSGGERQRVAIARALMNNPRVLFADEPTGNLDAETGRQIMDLLEKLHRELGQTIVMVTHDRALAREADRVLVLKAGKLEKAE